MERLTKLGRVMGEEKVCCTHFGCKECNDLSGQCSDGCSWEEMAWEKLFDYEETGLEPEQVKTFMKRVAEIVRTYERLDMERFKEILQAAEGGWLFMSPVKLGDMLWPICWDGVLGAWVVDDHPTRVNEVGSKGFFVSETYGKPEEIDEFYPYEMIGDEFFHTREEAVEAAATKKALEVCDYE